VYPRIVVNNNDVLFLIPGLTGNPESCAFLKVSFWIPDQVGNDMILPGDLVIDLGYILFIRIGKSQTIRLREVCGSR